MVLGSSSEGEDETLTIETAASNLETPRDEDALFHRVHDTLAELWDLVPKPLWFSLCAAFSTWKARWKLVPNTVKSSKIWRMVRSYAEIRWYDGPIPSPAWHSWTDAVEVNLRQIYSRGRLQARNDVSLNLGKPASIPMPT